MKKKTCKGSYCFLFSQGTPAQAIDAFRIPRQARLRVPMNLVTCVFSPYRLRSYCFIAFDFFFFFFFFLKFLCFLNKNNPGLGSQKFNVLSCQIICFLFNLFVIQTSPHFCSDPGTVPRNVYVNTFLKAVIKITILTKTPQKNQPPYTRFPSDLLKSTRSQKRSKCAWFRFEASRQMKWPDICLLGLLSEELTKRVTAFKQLPGEEDICLCFTSYSVLRPCLEKSMWGLAAVVLRQPVVIWLLS